MTSRILASKIASHRFSGQGYFKQKNALFAVPSPEKRLRSDENGPYPALRQALAVLGGFALAGIILLAFLSYLSVVVG